MIVPYTYALMTQDEGSPGRAVLFAVKKLPGNRAMFATCRHAWGEGRTTKLLVVNDKREVVDIASSNIVLSPNPYLDLLLLELPLPSGSEVLVGEAPIKDGTVLHHTRNVFRGSDGEGPVFSGFSAKASKTGVRAIFSDGRYPFIEEGSRKDALRAGANVFYEVLAMQSWPGVSGSPLWDQYGAIRGMVCGGTKDGEEALYGGHCLIYLPIKTIVKEAEEVSKNLREGRGLLKLR